MVLIWVALLAGALVASRQFGGSFNNDLTLSDTDSQAAYDTLRERFPDMSGDGMQVVIHSDKGVNSPEVMKTVEAVLTEVRADSDVAAARSPYGPGQRMVSSDGQTAMITVQFTERAKDIPEEAVTEAQEAFDPLREMGVQVEYGGPAVQTESGPSGSEIYGLIAAVIVLLIAFGSIFAMLVPILTALMALGLGIAVIELLTNWVTIGTSGPVVAAMIGLGVGIDYALLVVTRHREGLSLGHDPAESIERSMATAGRAVLVAGATVIVAILSLYLIGIPFVSALGLASAITVASTLLAAVTLLPALLGIFGNKLDRFRVRRIRFDHGGGREGGWHRWARGVQRWRWAAVPLAMGLLVVLALPLTSLRLGTADGGSQPTDTTQRKAYDLVADDFGPGWTGPLLVTVDYPAGTTPQQVQMDTGRLRGNLVSTEGVAQVSPPRIDPQGHTAVLTVVPTSSPDDDSTEKLVHRLRDDVLPAAANGAQTHVGGATATSIDLADKLDERMIWFMLLVVGLAFLVLLIEFRSLLVPLVAVVMNLLAVGAAYGPVVAVFQWGWWPADVIGAQPGPVESFAPVMLFAVLFGLSTDYAVFLLSRVHEEFRRSGDARRAVVNGMGATSRVILAAASVMVVVFSSFVLNDQRVVNLFGFGLAIAIAMYALVAMLVLIPALLAILGRAAWWAPGRTNKLATEEPVRSWTDPFESELDATDSADPAITAPIAVAPPAAAVEVPAAATAAVAAPAATTAEANGGKPVIVQVSRTERTANGALPLAGHESGEDYDRPFHATVASQGEGNGLTSRALTSMLATEDIPTGVKEQHEVTYEYRVEGLPEGSYTIELDFADDRSQPAGVASSGPWSNGNTEGRHVASSGTSEALGERTFTVRVVSDGGSVRVTHDGSGPVIKKFRLSSPN